MVRIFFVVGLFVLSHTLTLGQRVEKVVIDAGHGGKDPGAIGVTGIQEKDVALAVSLKVGNYIEEHFPNVEVVYTRSADEFIELYERARIANQANADLFISIHANSAQNSSAKGTETFVLGLHKTQANLEVAKRENAVVLLEDNADEHYDIDVNSPEAMIMMSMQQSAYLEQSMLFAEQVQYQFRERTQRKDRGVKQAGFLVLYRTTMPSVLVELGFLSNSSEESYLASELGRDYLASAIFRGFRTYKESMDALVSENELNNQEENKEQQPVDDSKNIYRIQVYASKYKASSSAKIYTDFDEVYIEDNGNGIYRHIVNSYSNYKEASVDLLNVVSKGYKGAYIIAYKDGKRVEINDAMSQVE